MRREGARARVDEALRAMEGGRILHQRPRRAVLRARIA